jgi:hypothetical protein
MTQFSVQTNEFLNTNKSIYEVVMLADKYGNLAGGTGGSSVDGFGRLRVSEPHTLFEASVRYVITGEKFSSLNTSSNTSITMSSNEGCVNLSISTANGDYIYRETKKVMGYQPGKSLLVMNSFTMASAQTNLRQRIGYFGANNGIYLEQTNSTVYWVKRKLNVDGTITNTAVAQEDWNVDTFDGTGPSGLLLDMSKAQLQWMDFEWLGVGSVRCGFAINGQLHIAHQFHHANEGTSTYMQTACLPIRLEIENLGTTANASIMKQICHTVMSEGGYNQVTTSRSVSNPIAGKTLPSGGVKTPMVSIKLKSDRLDAIVLPSKIEMYGFQATPFKWYIMRDCTLTSPSWSSLDSVSAVDYDISATAVTGTVVSEGVFKGQETITPIDLIEKMNHTLQLTRSLGSANGDIFSVVVESTTNNDKAITSLSWQEHII